MNIYIHVEISSRELDSKLLLATLAAERGHHVIVSNLSEIMNGFNSGVFNPGIFHTKSLTPSKRKINRHQKIINDNFIITSIDEEAGIDQFSYDQFSKDRYSDLTIGQAASVFCWGSKDEEVLKKMYSKNSFKIIKTGSPRVDLWKSLFQDYWQSPKNMPKKPFLLISSNINSTNMMQFHDVIKFQRDAGYFDRDPDLFKNLFHMMAENFRKLYSFIDAIKYLANNNDRFDIVLRPHPTENIQAWKIFLENVPNVHVVRQDSISTWVKNSFAVMHNGCTTAIEATISGKPVLTYVPFDMDYINEIPNLLGYKITTKDELLTKANEILDSKKNNFYEELAKKNFETISQKIYIDKEQLAAQKILNIWESFNDKKYSQPINLLKFNFYELFKVKRYFKKKIFKLFSKKINQKSENYKFPPLDKNEIIAKVSRLQKILGIKKTIECKFISEKTILIKKT